jgi:hypothetical protein
MLMHDNYKKLYLYIFFFGWVGIFYYILFFGGWSPTWLALGVPAMYPPFADMRTVQGAIHSIALGFNPQLNNPGDHWHRAMDYPMVWASMAQALRLNVNSHYLAFEVVIVCAFLLCCSRILTRSSSPWSLLMLFSGSTLLAVERGNNDLAIFSLIYLGSILPSVYRLAPFLLSVYLKVFPVLLFPALLNNKRAAAIFGSGSAIILLMLHDQLHNIARGNAIHGGLSYGISSMSLYLLTHLHIHIPGMVLAIVLLASSLVLSVSTAPSLFRPDSAHADGHDLLLFYLGASIYLGTFLLASNWDYRLIFVFMCFPYILRIKGAVIKYSTLTAAIVASNWHFYDLIHYPLFPLAEQINLLAKCALFVLLLSISLASIDIRNWKNHIWHIWGQSKN